MSLRKRTCTRGEAIRRVLHRGDVSVTGLAEILKALQSEGPELLTATRREMRKVQDVLFSELRLGIELQLSGGGEPFVWELADPLKLLPRIIKERSDIRQLFTAAVRRSPPSPERPWRLVVGFDAYQPGLQWIDARLRQSFFSASEGFGVCKHRCPQRQQTLF